VTVEEGVMSSVENGLSEKANNVNWLMANFVRSTPGVEQAVAVSSDGLLIALSSHLDRASADKMAAIITGMRALAQGAAGELSKGGVLQVLIEMANAYLFVTAISGGATLGVVAARDSDLGLVGYEITLLVERVGAQLSPGLITELKNSLVAV
jgi:predicted regulator of Ras-like GTPase activity (Roadblock/LC7/MglB family)